VAQNKEGYQVSGVGFQNLSTRFPDTRNLTPETLEC
jgi:hypothetical protein